MLEVCGSWSHDSVSQDRRSQVWGFQFEGLGFRVSDTGSLVLGLRVLDLGSQVLILDCVPCFLLSKFASQIRLIQSVVGSVASLRVPESSVSGAHVSRSKGSRSQSLGSHGPRVPDPGSQSPSVPCLRVPSPRSQGPRSQVLILDCAFFYILSFK